MKLLKNLLKRMATRNALPLNLAVLFELLTDLYSNIKKMVRLLLFTVIAVDVLLPLSLLMWRIWSFLPILTIILIPILFISVKSLKRILVSISLILLLTNGSEKKMSFLLKREKRPRNSWKKSLNRNLIRLPLKKLRIRLNWLSPLLMMKALILEDPDANILVKWFRWMPLHSNGFLVISGIFILLSMILPVLLLELILILRRL